MNGVVRVGVIGTGIGVTHIKVFRQVPGTEVVGVASGDLRRAERVAASYGLAFATDDYRQLLASDIDAVVIAAPPTLHRKMALDAIESRKHIFCEKPLSVTLGESQQMLHAVERSGLVHLVNFHLRYESTFSAAARLIQTNAIGTVANIDASVTVNPIDYLNASFGSDSKTSWFVDPAQGGGLLRSSGGPHLVDLVLWLGGTVESVSAITMTSQPRVAVSSHHNAIDVSVDDGFAVIGRLENGGIATIRGVPVAHHDTTFSVAVHGEYGTLFISAGELTGMLRGEDQIHVLPAAPRGHDARLAIATTFVDAIRAGDTSHRPNFSDGVRVQAMLDACTRSSELGSWVHVDPTPRHQLHIA